MIIYDNLWYIITYIYICMYSDVSWYSWSCMIYMIISLFYHVVSDVPLDPGLAHLKPWFPTSSNHFAPPRLDRNSIAWSVSEASRNPPKRDGKKGTPWSKMTFGARNSNQWHQVLHLTGGLIPKPVGEPTAVWEREGLPLSGGKPVFLIFLWGTCCGVFLIDFWAARDMWIGHLKIHCVFDQMLGTCGQHRL